MARMDLEVDVLRVTPAAADGGARGEGGAVRVPAALLLPQLAPPRRLQLAVAHRSREAQGPGDPLAGPCLPPPSVEGALSFRGWKDGVQRKFGRPPSVHVRARGLDRSMLRGVKFTDTELW